jgi:ankyrin repeat protein
VKGIALFGIAKSGLAALAAGAALSLAVPAQGQSYSPAHKFLEAVDKKNGTEIVDMLAQPGSTLINSRDLATNRTALHIVVERRDLTWLNFLLARGADPNLADNKGVTPLLLACRIGFLDAVDALVKKGARVDEGNSTGETPLMSAVHSRNVPLMRALLLAGADPDRADNSGRSARDYAKLEAGAQSQVVAEIDRSAKPRSERASNQTYGPS